MLRAAAWQKMRRFQFLVTDLVIWVIWISALAELFVSVFLTLYSP